MSRKISLTVVLALLGVASCKPAFQASEQVVYANPLDSLESSLTKTGVAADQGALRIDASGPATIALAEFSPKTNEPTTLFYRAKLRSQDLNGQAYLEMLVAVPGMGEFFSRALDKPLTGTSDWVTQQTPFLLAEGQRADLVKLNLVVTGPGTVWIDELEVAQAR